MGFQDIKNMCTWLKKNAQWKVSANKPESVNYLQQKYERVISEWNSQVPFEISRTFPSTLLDCIWQLQIRRSKSLICWERLNGPHNEAQEYREGALPSAPSPIYKSLKLQESIKSTLRPKSQPLCILIQQDDFPGKYYVYWSIYIYT